MNEINKAAEEGELPALPEAAVYDKVPFGSRIGYTAGQMQDYARQAIAADRASRQVANKAEVDTQMLDFLGSSAVVSVHQYEPREGAAYIAIDLDAPGSPTVRGSTIREAIGKAMGIATPSPTKESK